MSIGRTKRIELGQGLSLELAWISIGAFMMGTAEDEAERFADETLHRVQLRRGFWIGRYPVTQAQYRAVTGANPSAFPGADHPVDQVSWEDAVAFCDRVPGLRLPTEAEWEYGCRAGTTTRFHSGDREEDLAAAGWYRGNSNETTQPVGQKNANSWGLYDMHGNVWEWCADWYGAYPPGEALDPPGPVSGTERVLRGGSWLSLPEESRSGSRVGCEPGDRDDDHGFRVCLDDR